MKGEAQVFPKPGKSFDPVQIPKAIKEAGFSTPEVLVEADGTLSKGEGSFRLDVPGLNHAFALSGGAQIDALAAHAHLIGKTVRIAGKLQIDHSDLPPRLTVESFRQTP